MPVRLFSSKDRVHRDTGTLLSRPAVLVSLISHVGDHLRGLISVKVGVAKARAHGIDDNASIRNGEATRKEEHDKDIEDFGQSVSSNQQTFY